VKRIYLLGAILLLFCAWRFGFARRPRPAHADHVAHVAAAGLPGSAGKFIEARCIDCHDATSKKWGLNFEGLSTELNDPPTEAKWTRIFDRVQRREMPPRKEPQPSEEERTAFMGSLGGFLSEHDAARRAPAGRVVWRRLNRVEYENTVHDLLAIDTPLAELLPEDAAAGGFDTVAEGLRLSASQIEAYLAAAETALNAAINLQPKPMPQKERIAFLDLPRVKEALAVPSEGIVQKGGRNMPLFRALPDAMVMFINRANKVNVFTPPAPEAGLYRVRLSVYAYQNKGGPTVVAKLIASDLQNYRWVAAFDLPSDTPRVAETTVRLEKDERLILAAEGCGLAADGSDVRKVGAANFTGSGLAAQWAELEGPLMEAWPPASVQRVLGDLPLKELPAGHEGDRGYEIGNVSSGKLDEIITAFARRAFRRPVKNEDVAPYARLAHQAMEEGVGLEGALRRCFKAILASPEFLFFRETPGALDDYALASRLSYFLWSTMPDDELLRVAEQGTLHDSAVLRAQTERLLTSPKAHAFVENFCGQWLNLRAIAATTPDKKLYPEFDELLQDAMVKETENFFAEVLRSDLGVATLIDSDFAMLNRRLAEHYGIAGVRGEEFRKVALPAGSHRGGLLTQASILKVTANGTLTSPVVRGAWVMKRIMGREIQPPPPDAGKIEPDTRGATTIREQLAKHRRSETCAGCHKYMDPFGFALENYDVIGGWRESYRKAKGKPAQDAFTHKPLDYSMGLPVDPSGELVDGSRFANIDQLKKLLLDQQEVIARNLANNLVAYSTGATVTFSDRAEVEKILQSGKSNSYPVRGMVYAIVQSPLFQTK